MSEYKKTRSRYDVWVDGSAVEFLSPVRLGAGWVAAVRNKVVTGGSHQILETPPNKSVTLFAEVNAAIIALEAMTRKRPMLDYSIRLYTDRREIRECVNKRAVADQIYKSQPEMVPLFQQFLGLMEGVLIRAYRSRGSKPQSKTLLTRADCEKLGHHFSHVAHDAAHTLAARASGSQKVLQYPRLDEVLAVLER